MAGNHHCQGQGGLPSGPSCALGVPGVGLRRRSRHSLLVYTRALAQRGSKQARGCPRCQQGHLTQGAVSCSACEHFGYTTSGRGSVGVALCDSLAHSDALLGPLEHCFQPLKDPRRQVDHTLAYGQHGLSGKLLHYHGSLALLKLKDCGMAASEYSEPSFSSTSTPVVRRTAA